MVSVRKIATCMLVGTLAFAGHTETAKASETPVAGIDMVLSNINFGSQAVNIGLQTFLLSISDEPENDLAFAKVDNYVNIRSESNEDSKILGKLYKDSAATILKKEGEWYQVKSGAVTGYIKADFLLTGENAVEFSKKVGDTFATVNTATLRVREKASEQSGIVTLIPIGEEYKVVSEKKDWVKIRIDQETTGYVSKNYVTLQKEYAEAVSIEEEQARLEREAQEAVQSMSVSSAQRSDTVQRSTAKSEVKSSSISVNEPVTSQASDNSSLRNQIVNYALQFEGNPYVWGGTSLTRGADCSGFTQSILEHFGIYIPRTSRAQGASGKRVDMDNIQPGDLIFYRKNGTINHVALYIGNGKVISAKSSREGIRITNYNYRTPYKAVSYIN